MSDTFKKLGLALACGVVAALGFFLFFKAMPSPETSFGISENATSFTDLNVTNETNSVTLAVSGQTTLTGPLTASATSTLSGPTIISGELSTGLLHPGGAVTDISTSSNAYTLTAANVCDSSVIRMTPLGAALTLTLPSTSTLATDCLSAAGKSHTFLFSNEASAATNTTIAAPSGVTLISDDANGDVIAQNGWAEVVMTFVTTGEFTAVVRPFLDAD